MSKFILKSMPSKAYLQKEQVPEVEQYVHNSTESHDLSITNLDLVVEEQVLNGLEQVLNVGRDVVSRPLEYKVEKVKGEKEKEELCVCVCVCVCVLGGWVHLIQTPAFPFHFHALNSNMHVTRSIPHSTIGLVYV